MTTTESLSAFSPASALARAELLDHAKHPRNKREMPDADIVQEEANPLCGDVVTMYATFRHPERSEGSPSLSSRDPASPAAPQDDTVIDHVGFTGSGCIISQAAASMLSEVVTGKSVTEIEAMERKDVEALLGATLSPSRVKCAMLPLIALKNGLIRHAHHS